MDHTPDSRIAQFVKFCLVGVMNTLVTLCAIFLCKSLLGVNQYVSNAIGYILGVINSFLWNKQWVFNTVGHYRREAVRFACGFLLCYTLQLLTVIALNTSSLGDLVIDTGYIVISGYAVATLAGCCVYTVTNFIYNRLITFRQ